VQHVKRCYGAAACVHADLVLDAVDREQRVTDTACHLRAARHNGGAFQLEPSFWHHVYYSIQLK
jgi:hypothetical protein